MARPLLDESQLKHKRRIRKSPNKFHASTIPVASKAAIKRCQPLTNLCIAAVLANEREDNKGIKTKVEVFFANGAKKPDNFPIGRTVSKTDKGTAISYNAELLLVWLYDRGLTQFTPHDLYRAKSGLLTYLEKSIDSVWELDL